MDLLYYPGCTIKRNAMEYEKTTIAILKKIGINVVELDKWYCCGALYSLAVDDIAKHLGAVRTLISAENMSSKHNTNKLLTICPMCFNVLRRVNKLLKENPDKLDTINQYLEEETYKLSITVIHVVEVLKEYINELKRHIVRKPNDTPISVYYGCTIVRPKDIGIDNPEDPRIIEGILRELGFNVVDIPYKTLCCGAFHVLSNRDIVYRNSLKILESVNNSGAKILVTVCPLCLYNLRLTLENVKTRADVKVIYLTELLAYTMGLDESLSQATLDVLNKFFQSTLDKNS